MTVAFFQDCTFHVKHEMEISTTSFPMAAPPALSSGGKLRFGVKADLLHCLESNLPENKSVPETDAVILDGAVVIQMLNPNKSRTFQEYGETVFVPYISAQLQVGDRVDLVWDVYLYASLKASTRQKRGNGMRKRVAPLTVMPKNWKDFLRCDENKTELFSFLARESINLPVAQGKELYATDGTGVLCSPADLCVARLAPCSQEEAEQCCAERL